MVLLSQKIDIWEEGKSALSNKRVGELSVIANEIRQSIVSMLLMAGSGHTAGALGMADIFSALYFYAMNHDPARPMWRDRDRLVISNGHICPVLYAALAHAGYMPVDELSSLRKFGSRLQGHPHREFLALAETSSGPLGSGLSQACGMALGLMMDGKKSHVYCVMSDAEHDEGNTWEAVMFAGKEKLHNLIAIIDRNEIQIGGYTEDVMPLEPFANKYISFGWHVIEIDGNNMVEITSALRDARAVKDRPVAIIAHTVPGKGVSEFENKYEWHGKVPNKEEAERALSELRSNLEKIKKENQ